MFITSIPASVISEISQFEERDLTVGLSDDASVIEEKFESSDDDDNVIVESKLATADGSLMCRVCGKYSGNDKRAHYKSDFHNYNIKRRVKGLNACDEHEFDLKLETGSVSSVDGSDDEQETMNVGVESKNSPFFGFKLKNEKEILLAYKQIFVNKAALKDNAVSVESLVERLKRLSRPQGLTWTMMMLGSGHFSAAIFDLTTGKVITQKSFHRYTTRRKQGGAQSNNDNSKGKAKSAGAALRRYNEMALKAEIKDLLIQWKDLLKKSDLIFTRVPPSHQTAVFFDNSILNPKDPRLRTFPFTTKRPTFNELKRCYEELLTVKIEEREIIIKNEPTSTLETEELVSKSKVKKSSQIPAEKQKAELLDQPEPLDKDLDKLLEFCRKGKCLLFASHLGKCSVDVNVELPMAHGTSFLHVAASKGHEDLVFMLLEMGADPTVSRGKTKPYHQASTKETRNAFRRFMALFPDKWDYEVAGVPSALTAEMEEKQRLKEQQQEEERVAAEKKREQLLAQEQEKKQREVRKKFAVTKLSNTQKQELSMTPEARAALDREKRAIAAEARIRTQVNKCAACGVDLEGKVPFEKFNFKYCCIDCVKKHHILNED